MADCGSRNEMEWSGNRVAVLSIWAESLADCASRRGTPDEFAVDGEPVEDVQLPVKVGGRGMKRR